jgi:hypothetical protein
MAIRRAQRQMSASAERPGVGRGEALSDSVSDEVRRPRHEAESTGPGLLSAVLARENMQQAWKRVRSNKGAAGVDGLDIDPTAARLRNEWPAIREQLLSGTYRPQPVRRVTIPKPDGGERELGIPTVTDRLIQQSLLQVLQPILDPTFSPHSYGFRPGRSAHQAVHWKAYFRLAQTPRVWQELDKWMRHRMRAIQLKHWKRAETIYSELLVRKAFSDVAAQVAGNSRRWWRNSGMLLNSVLNLAWADRLGVPRLC